jgi:NAD(P)H-dependent flavin oxidoreductase YrpB (nitropropane dioxygenase family)
VENSDIKNGAKVILQQGSESGGQRSVSNVTTKELWKRVK